MRGRAVYATLMKFVIISNETGNLCRVAHKSQKTLTKYSSSQYVPYLFYVPIYGFVCVLPMQV